MVDEARDHWVVGSTFKHRSEDQLYRFIKEGVWEIHTPSEADEALVKSMKVGDAIAIKATFVQKYDLPFENHSQSVSVLRIKARGKISDNPNDGERVFVDWDDNFAERDWYFYTFRRTIWKLDPAEPMAQRLIAFAFHDKPQDYDWFLDQPYWHQKYSKVDGDDSSPAIWIEKTIVKGRPDRLEGNDRLGKALWSPQRSKSGGDIYANMRAAKAGDIVLHLTDNESFSGISVVADKADDEFQGVAGTEWAGDCYRVPLSDYSALEPPLRREELLKKQPYADELKELIEAGAKGLFFNSKLDLNQGAYLTEATPTLVSILNRAYLDAAGKQLPMIGDEAAIHERRNESSQPYSIEDALEALFLDQEDLESILLLWKAKKNIVLQGPPGVGKSFAAEKLAFALMEEADRDRVGFVQFHQSYSYEDFVEGYRPTEKGFELKAGKFVQFCRRAEADPDRRYVFIIDEINRGNLSKILGELMLLVEGDKRGSKWAMPLASGKVAFHVPPNVYLLGLMNTADRSLAVVDYALRRRFGFVDLAPQIGSDKFVALLIANGVTEAVIDRIVKRVGLLNDEIVADKVNLGPGFAIGHSYFCGKPLAGETNDGWYTRIIRTEIAPLLREYWFDNLQRAAEWETELLGV